MVSELTGAAVVPGPRIHSVFDTADKLQAACDDLLGAPRDADKKDLKVARLSGIRELYLMLTGDYDLHGGFDAERVQFATTADFTGLVKNALNKIVVNTWSELGKAGYDWWSRIARVEHFNSLNTITGTLVGTVGTLPTVAEGAEYHRAGCRRFPGNGRLHQVWWLYPPHLGAHRSRYLPQTGGLSP